MYFNNIIILYMYYYAFVFSLYKVIPRYLFWSVQWLPLLHDSVFHGFNYLQSTTVQKHMILLLTDH